VGGGIALGTLYALSPLTVWFSAAMAGVFLWAGHGLTASERRAVWGILAVAVAVRVLAIVVLFATSEPGTNPSFFWDGDGVYLKHRSLVIRDVWLGVPTGTVDFTDGFSRSYGWSSYLYMLAYVQYLTAPSPFAVHLQNVFLFLVAAVVLHRMVRPAFGAASAWLGLALMLLLPTLIAWSVAALKEALYVFLTALAVRAVVMAARATPAYARLVGLALLVGAVAANSTVRPGASVIMGGGIMIGIVGSVLVRRLVLVLLLTVSAPVAAVWLSQQPEVQVAVATQLRRGAATHMGNVRTEGNSYKLLDQRIYSDRDFTISTMTTQEALRFSVRAVVSLVAVPLPWQVVSRAELVFLGQQVIWWLLVILAGVGCVAGVKRDSLVTCLLAGIAVVGGVTIALNSGNIGTMVRFRDTIVPFVVWLSARGAISLVSGIGSRRAPEPVTSSIEAIPV
jgi:hypothetical protein